MTKIALGTAQFGLDYGVANDAGQVKSAEVEQILLKAKQNGVEILDTAIAYGTSEEVLGRIGVDGFRVVTKLPPLPENQKNVAYWVNEYVRESIARLGQKNLFGLLLHRPQDLLSLNGAQLIQALVDLKNDGIVQKFGISIYSPDELEEIFKRFQLDLVQAPLNVLDRRMETSGWLDRLKKNGVEVHTRSAFLQGLLLIEPNKIPEQFSRWSNLFDQWHKKLKDSGLSPLEACLGYPISLEQVERVIVGVESAKQLQDILTAISVVDYAMDSSFMSMEDLDLINPSNWKSG